MHHWPGSAGLLRRRVLLIVAAGALIVAPLLWYRARLSEYEARVAVYAEQQEKMEAAMRADTYGGKTPEATMELFIAALERGDIELAAKYFLIKADPDDPDLFGRGEWPEALRKTMAADKIPETLSRLRRLEPIEGRLDDEDYKLVGKDENGGLTAYIDMQLNTFSGVWKIESL